MKSSILTAVLVNEHGSCHLGSNDWEMILSMYVYPAKLWGGPDGRWDNKHESWIWTGKEAADLANALETAPIVCLTGASWIDDHDDRGIIWTRIGTEKSEDGLMPEQRKQRLIGFLRQGGFQWGFQYKEI